MGLTRQERLEQYVVCYDNPSLPTPKESTSKAGMKTPNTFKPSTSRNSSTNTSRATPQIPATTPKNVSRSAMRKKPLPSGWAREVRIKDGKEMIVYISDNGEEMPVKRK